MWVLRVMRFGLPAVLVPAMALAQTQATAARSWAVEASAGHAEFVESPPVPHSVISAAARVYLTPRIAVGPEFTWMGGRAGHYDTFLTGNLTWDLGASRAAGAVRLVPFVVGGLGVTSTTDPFPAGPYTSMEGTFTAGGGVRIEAPRGFYVAPELRIGWEPHWRAALTFGFKR